MRYFSECNLCTVFLVKSNGGITKNEVILFFVLFTEAEQLPWDPLPDEVIPEPEDDVMIRLEEIENPDFDDHFDLVKREHLLGKTLAKMASQGIKDSFLTNSLQLLGYTLYEKWDKVSEIIQKDKEFDQDCIENALHYVSTLDNIEMETKLKG